MKSIPRFKPLIASEPTLMTTKMAAMIKAVLRKSMKSKFVFCKKLRVALVEKVMSFSFSSIRAKISLEMKIDVNSEVRIPTQRVTAKLWTGPVPKMIRITPVIKVVTLPSIMAE